MSIEVEVGNVYRSRDGEYVNILEESPLHGERPYVGDNGNYYAKHGKVQIGTDSPEDLVELVGKTSKIILSVNRYYRDKKDDLVWIREYTTREDGRRIFISSKGQEFSVDGVYWGTHPDYSDIVKELPVLNLEVGRTYLNSNGNMCTIVRRVNQYFLDNNGLTYSERGELKRDRSVYPIDLVEEVKSPRDNDRNTERTTTDQTYARNADNVSSLRLEVGKKYLNGYGKAVEIVHALHPPKGRVYVYIDNVGDWYLPNGRMFSADNRLDLVSEYIEDKEKQEVLQTGLYWYRHDAKSNVVVVHVNNISSNMFTISFLGMVPIFYNYGTDTATRVLKNILGPVEPYKPTSSEHVYSSNTRLDIPPHHVQVQTDYEDVHPGDVLVVVESVLGLDVGEMYEVKQVDGSDRRVDLYIDTPFGQIPINRFPNQPDNIWKMRGLVKVATSN